MAKSPAAIQSDLEDIQKSIEKAKLGKATASGRLDELMERLKTDHGVKTIKAAEDKLAKMNTRIEELTEKLQDDYEQLLDELESE